MISSLRQAALRQYPGNAETDIADLNPGFRPTAYRRCLDTAVEQKNLGGNTARLAPIQKSPIPEFSMFGSRDEMSASGKVVVNGGLD